MMSKYAKHGLKERKDYIYKLIVTVYEICLEDLAFMKIKSLVEMQAKSWSRSWQWFCVHELFIRHRIS